MTASLDSAPDATSRASPLASAARVARSGAIFVVLAAMLAGFALAEPAFLSAANVLSVLQAVSVVAVLATGVTVTLAVGGFDLSIGAVAAASVMAASYVMVVWHVSVLTTVQLVLAFVAAV